MSSRRGELAKNTGIYAIGVFSTKLITFILVPIYSYYLTKDNLGQYDVLLTGLLLISPVISLQLSESTFRWLIETDESERKDKILTTSSLTVVLLLLLGFCLTAAVCAITGHIDKLWIYALVITNVFFIFLQQVSRGLKKSSFYVKGVMLNSILLLSSSIFALTYVGQSVEVLLLSMLFSTGCSALYLAASLGLIRRHKSEHVDIDMAKGMIQYSMPLIPNAASWWLISAANRMIVLYYLGTESNGVFAISARIPGILTILNSIFMLSWQDSILSEKESAKDYKSAILKKFILFESCVVVIVIFAAKYLTKHLLHEDYYESWYYMPLLVVGTAFAALSAFLGVNFLKSKQTSTLFTTTLTGGAVNVILSIALIEHIGLYAPAVGTLLGFATAFLLRSRHRVTKEALEIPGRKIVAFLFVTASTIYLATLELWYINVLGSVAAIVYLGVELAPLVTRIIKRFTSIRKPKTN